MGGAHSPLMGAALAGNTRCMRTLLRARASMELTSAFGLTAADLATRAGNVAAVRLLREAVLLAKEMGVDGVHNCGQDLGEDEWEEARAA